ncbi:MAG: group II intron reverse transcriptase/maturase [Candidatus Dormibacteraeota bacterium]|nr:group II intron reverse transcriptase/maturase [Candidatus Dormibacteraeota bacterium]
MAQQKSEDRVVPEGGVMPAERAGSSPGGRGKAVPVEETAVQLCLPIATAENPQGATRRSTRDRLGVIRAGAPKAIGNAESAAPATMEEVAKRLTDALLKVASNKGAPGPDGRTIEQLLEQWPVVFPRLRAALLEGTYRPGDIRRAYIPKAGRGQRGLGIPDVVDRVVQEAVRQVLEPLWEPTFHPSSHGFRPGRSCHTAIAEASQHLTDGYGWLADLDLEKFFDLVCHQRLTAKLAERVGDRRLLVLIGRMLKAKVVLPDGVAIDSEQGVPQGGPLSPLLSNIVLDELDRELARRGHRFVRYADDAKVYVRSERAGRRVMVSLTRFIEGRLRLRVNQAKSAVARPEERHFLGFRLRLDPQSGGVEVLLSKRTMRNAMERVRQLTPRNWGGRLESCIARINAWLVGWHQFFGIASAAEMQMMRKLDSHIRRRLRAIILRHWKRKRTIAKRLVKLGVPRRSAWKQVYQGRRSWWALSHIPAVDHGLRNAYFAKRGLASVVELHRHAHQHIVAPEPPQLALWG